MNPSENTAILQKAYYQVNKYQALLDLISQHSDPEGICRLSPKVIANFLDVEVVDVATWLVHLIDLGFIEKKATYYRVIPMNVKKSPLEWFKDLLNLIGERPSLNFNQQAEALNISLKDLEFLYGYFVYTSQRS
ncbi:hypothetical protein D3C73_484000 [compost metagenome]